MNEPIQAMAEQEWPPSQAEQVDTMLENMVSGESWGFSLVEVTELLKKHIALLRRQAAKAGNRRKTIRDLHRHHRAIIMENRWLREAIRIGGTQIGQGVWNKVLERAGKSLWRTFRKELDDPTICPKHGRTQHKIADGIYATCAHCQGQDMDRTTITPAQIQVDRLAEFILAEVPGESPQPKQAVDTAIRVIRKFRKTVDTIDKSHMDTGELVNFLMKLTAVDMGHFVTEEPVKMAIRIITGQQARIKQLANPPGGQQ